MGSHVLVTGGAGYLGSVLCESLLAVGHRVTVLDSLLYNQQSVFHLCANPNFEFVRGDVRDERVLGELVPHADVLIPLAAIVGAGGFVRVNSRHHQGVNEPVKAPSLMASAYSLEEGLIEAMESPNHDWVIAVQWHNENREELPKSFGNLFLALAERGETYSQRMAALPARRAASV